MLGTGWSLISAAGIDLDVSFWTISWMRAFQVVWLPFLFIPMSAVSYVGVPVDAQQQRLGTDQPDAQPGRQHRGVVREHAAVLARGSFIRPVSAPHITSYNGYGFGHSLAQIAQAVQQQAGILSYLDIFWLLGVIALCICPGGDLSATNAEGRGSRALTEGT